MHNFEIGLYVPQEKLKRFITQTFINESWSRVNLKAEIGIFCVAFLNKFRKSRWNFLQKWWDIINVSKLQNLQIFREKRFTQLVRVQKLKS